MPKIPSIPQQLRLTSCQAPAPNVPDWETLGEATQSAMRAALAKLIVRLATSNEEGREHE